MPSTPASSAARAKAAMLAGSSHAPPSSSLCKGYSSMNRIRVTLPRLLDSMQKRSAGGVALAPLGGGLVERGLQVGVERRLGGGNAVGQLLRAAGADDRRGDG